MLKSVGWWILWVNKLGRDRQTDRILKLLRLLKEVRLRHGLLGMLNAAAHMMRINLDPDPASMKYCQNHLSCTQTFGMI